jgi:hypothetical protein
MSCTSASVRPRHLESSLVGDEVMRFAFHLVERREVFQRLLADWALAWIPHTHLPRT